MNYKKIILSLALPQLAGVIGLVFTRPAISNWYAGLEKPSFNPPNWVFGPAWTILYILMGISIYLIWQKIKENKKAKGAFWLFWVHLFFNAIWSIIFFGFQSPGWALIIIAIIWLFIVTMMIRFWKISHWATYLLLPYLLWVSFASFLNYFIWFLN
jgi:translocator protein